MSTKTHSLSQTLLFPPPPCLAMVLPHRSGVRPHMVTFPSGTLRTFLGPFTQQKQCGSSKDLEGDPPTACWFSCLCFHHTDIPKSGWAPQAELAHVYSVAVLELGDKWTHRSTVCRDSSQQRLPKRKGSGSDAAMAFLVINSTDPQRLRWFSVSNKSLPR